MLRRDKIFYTMWTVMFLMAFLPNIVAFFYAGISIKGMLYLFLGVLFCLFPALFLKSKVYFGIFFLFVLLAPIEIGHIFINKVPLTTGFLMTLFNTSTGEVLSYISGMKWLAFASVFCWIVYVYLWIKISNRYVLPRKHWKYGWVSYAVLFVALTGLAVFSHYRKQASVPVLSTVKYSFAVKFRNTYPYNVVGKISKAVKETKATKNRIKNIKDFSFHPVVKTGNEREIYVFVIGESTRYAHFGINGYERNTTPLLDSLHQEGGLLSFSNVYTTGNLTSNVLPVMMTQATVQEKEIANKEKSLIALCSEAGFKTYILSNQDDSELFLRQITSEADYNFDFDTKNFDTRYDGLFLPVIDSILNSDEKKICVFFFTQGSHFRYDHRYPASFEKFKPVLENSSFAHDISYKVRDKIINTYDNSILYTDYVLTQIIKSIDKEDCKASFFYISDHGENLFDTPDVSVGHGSINPTDNELHIPMFIWFSKKYIEKDNNVFINLKNNIDKKINTTNVFYTFANIAGIRYNMYQMNKDVSSCSFVPDSVYWILDVNQESLRIE